MSKVSRSSVAFTIKGNTGNLYCLCSSTRFSRPRSLYASISELNTLCRKNNLEPIGNIMARYYDDYQQYDPDCADVEVSIQIDLNHEIGGVVRKEPGYLCVSALHYGPYRDEYKTYTLMMEWMKKNNLVMCGPALEY